MVLIASVLLVVISLFIFIFFIKYHIVLTLIALVMPLVLLINYTILWSNIYLIVNSYWSYCILLILLHLNNPNNTIFSIMFSKLVHYSFYKKLMFVLIL